MATHLYSVKIQKEKLPVEFSSLTLIPPNPKPSSRATACARNMTKRASKIPSDKQVKQVQIQFRKDNLLVHHDRSQDETALVLLT